MANAIQTSKSSNFQPSMSAQQTAGYVKHYQLFPQLYDDNQKNQIEEHAHYYRIGVSREQTNPG